ncbi:MAG: efflux RND transporter periplasmic adaptor subunit [Bacteroidetes bacterium]|nr:efflux RND transporter periplasmic adaptor subunit [Bacteroidota bacterium]
MNKRIWKQGLQYTCLILCIGATSCKSNTSAPPAPPTPQVSVQQAALSDENYYDEYPATITPLNQVDLKPQVSGFITGVYFKDGARVRKGQLLYAIDQQLYHANYEQAVANLKVQQANEAKAQKDANRYHELDKYDAVAKQLVDNADAALEVSKKQADAARANIRAVQTNVNYTKVFAPFDGVIGISLVKPGAAVTAGQTLLNTVSSDNLLAVDFNVDQKEILRFGKLLKDKTDIRDSVFTLTIGDTEYPYPGSISLIDRAVNPQTGTIKVRIVFPNKEDLLKAGMNVTMRVKSNNAEKSVVIPYKAVTEQLGEYFVYVPGDSSKVSQRKISLGKQLGFNVIVKDGLQAGENVVIQGQQNLKEGMKVKIVPNSTH